MVEEMIYQHDENRFALAQAFKDVREGVICEFGVYEGQSIRNIAKLIAPRIVYGFDSFEGLPEDWGNRDKKGTFKTEQPQNLPPNVRIIPGMFADTIPHFFVGKTAALVHIDCDLYSSTMTVLTSVPFAAGCILIFDEITGDSDCTENEGRAFEWYLDHTSRGVECLGRHHRNGAIFRLL